MEISDLIIKTTVTVTGLSIAVVVMYMLFFFIVIPERPLRELTYFVLIVFSFSLLMTTITTGSILYTLHNAGVFSTISENRFNPD